MAEPETPLPRGYRLRVVGFVAGAFTIAGLLYVGQDFVATLKRLEVVERERDGWQRPADILRALDLHDGSLVADLGCGSGYFTLKLSPSVSPRGRVFAVDVRELPLFVVRVRTWARRIHNVLVIHGRPDAPGLASDGLDAVLVLNTYHELTPLEGEAGLRASGFEIVERDDAFIDRPGDPDLWWMIVARRP